MLVPFGILYGIGLLKQSRISLVKCERDNSESNISKLLNSNEFEKILTSPEIYKED